MNTQYLIAFREVALKSSISMAAESLHLTQPAISKRIQCLETQLDMLLFDRIGKKLLLTQAGKYLLPKAIEILQLMSATKQGLSDLDGEVGGDLTLITSHHVGLHRLPKVLEQYKKRFPKVKLNIQFMNSSETYSSILSSQGDLGITTQEKVDEANLYSMIAWDDPLCFVCAKDHPLSKISNLQLIDLTGFPVILPDMSFNTSRMVMEVFSDQDLSLNIDEGLTTNFLETIKALVSIGEAWSVLPKTMLENNKELMAIYPEGVLLSRKLVCIHHRKRTLNNASKAFLELLSCD